MPTRSDMFKLIRIVEDRGNNRVTGAFQVLTNAKFGDMTKKYFCRNTDVMNSTRVDRGQAIQAKYIGLKALFDYENPAAATVEAREFVVQFESTPGVTYYLYDVYKSAESKYIPRRLIARAESGALRTRMPCVNHVFPST